MSYYHEGLYDIYNTTLDYEQYIGRYRVFNKTKETWFGTGTGYQINDHFSLGWSTFITSYNKRHFLLQEGTVLRTDNSNNIITMGTSKVDEQVIFNATGWVNILGVNYKKKQLVSGFYCHPTKG